MNKLALLAIISLLAITSFTYADDTLTFDMNTKENVKMEISIVFNKIQPDKATQILEILRQYFGNNPTYQTACKFAVKVGPTDQDINHVSQYGQYKNFGGLGLTD